VNRVLGAPRATDIGGKGAACRADNLSLGNEVISPKRLLNHVVAKQDIIV
jgi:hypothetical protein